MQCEAVNNFTCTLKSVFIFSRQYYDKGRGFIVGPVNPRMLSLALTFLLLLLHDPANSYTPTTSTNARTSPITLPCEIMGWEMEDLKAKRQSVLSKHKAAKWRAYQMKYKLQKMEEHQSSLKKWLKVCDDGTMVFTPREEGLLP